MRLLIDVDGVICKYNYGDIVKKHFGVEIDEYNVFAQDMSDVLGVKSEEINKMFYNQVHNQPQFIENALPTLKTLYNKHEIIIFTNRTKYMSLEELTKWLIENNIPFHGIDVQGTGEYQFHVDDSPAKLMKTNSKVKLLFSQSWNRRCLNITGSLKRVYSWNDVAELVSIGGYSEGI
jgi:uncharacterized HAD superfamily protein